MRRDVSDIAKREAQRSTMGFSDPLHARIMRTVASAEMEPAGEEPSWRATTTRSLAMAAAVLLAFGGGWFSSRFYNHPPTSRIAETVEDRGQAATGAASAPTVLALDESAHRFNVRVQGAVQTAMAEQQWAGLDRDMRRATRYLVDQVPFRSAWESDRPARDHE